VRDGKNDSVASAQYWCNANGTVLSFREYNNTDCEAHDAVHVGNYSVPFTRDGYTFDCECWARDVFVESREYNNTLESEAQPWKSNKANGVPPGRHPEHGYQKRPGNPDPKCGGSYDSRLTMSGSCFGYFDNATHDVRSSATSR
jgi:hypothetical protein